MKSLGLLKLLRKQLSRLHNSDNPSPQEVVGLRQLIRSPTWAYLVEQVQQEYSREQERLLRERDIHEFARRQGRLEAMEKVIGLPYIILDTGDDDARKARP